MRVLLLFIGIIKKEEYYNTELWPWWKFYGWLLLFKPGNVGGND